MEGRYGADFQRLDLFLRRVIHPRVFAVQGTEATSKLFGGVESVPTYFLYDRNGNLVWQLGGTAEEQSQHRIDTAVLDKVIGR